MSLPPERQTPSFYPDRTRSPFLVPTLILTTLAGLCQMLLILGAALGKFSWLFALIWMVLLLGHLTNIAVAAYGSRRSLQSPAAGRP